MAWEDRLLEAAYNTPSGRRLPFIFTAVRRGTELRGTRYSFSDHQGTFVQQTGSDGQSFPMRIFFNGDDHDLQAEEFFQAVREPGVGALEHPQYGVLNVVPLGRVVQRNDLVRAPNESVLEFTFFEHDPSLFPGGGQDPASQVVASVQEYNETSAQEFEEAIDVDTPVERTSLANQIRQRVGQIRDQLDDVADAVDEIQSEFEDISDSITDAIDTLVGTPLNLAFQISQLVQAPGRSIAAWSDKLEAYGNLARQIFGSEPRTPSRDGRAVNSFEADSLVAAGALTGAITGAVNNTFTTQPEAIEAAQELLALSADLNNWREENFASLDRVDTGASYQQWQEAVTLCAGFLVEISFTLNQERIIVLDRPRSIIDLCAELYQDVSDDRLNFFINSNDMTGDEFREIPVGASIKYYV